MSLKALLLSNRSHESAQTAGPSSGALSEDSVSWGNPAFLEAGRVLYSVCWDGSRFVAVGASGLILVSDTTGANWTQVVSGTSSSLYSVDAKDPYDMRASGLNGVVRVSHSGGHTWEPYLGIGTRPVWDVGHALNDTWLYVNDEGRILYSTATHGPTTVYNAGTALYTLAARKTESSAYVVGGVNGIYYSTNLTSWSTALWVANSFIRGICASPTCFIAVGLNKQVYRSINGIDWTLVHTAALQLIDVTWTGSMFIAVGRAAGGIITSTDGYSWTVRMSGSTNVLHSVAASPDVVIVAMSDGLIRLTRT